MKKILALALALLAAVVPAAYAQISTGNVYGTVTDESGAVLGRVEGFFDTGDTGAMVVKRERERMIPFVPEYVKSVDRATRSITVDWKADYDA